MLHSVTDVEILYRFNYQIKATPRCCHLLQCRGQLVTPHFYFTALTSFSITAFPLSPHCLHLSVSLCQGPHLHTVPGPLFQLPLSPTFPLRKDKTSQSREAKRVLFHGQRDPGEPLLTLTCLLLGLCCRLPPTFHEEYFPLHFSFPTLNLSIIQFQVKTAGILYSLSSSI